MLGYKDMKGEKIGARDERRPARKVDRGAITCTLKYNSTSLIAWVMFFKDLVEGVSLFEEVMTLYRKKRVKRNRITSKLMETVTNICATGKLRQENYHNEIKRIYSLTYSEFIKTSCKTKNIGKSLHLSSLAFTQEVFSSSHHPKGVVKSFHISLALLQKYS